MRMRALKITEALTLRETHSFKQYLKEVANIPLFATIEEEVECSHRASKGDQRAINELVNRNLRFVISVAKQYVKSGVTLEDLVNEGNIGLIDAASKYDPTQGTKFISFAVWHIRKEILKFLYTNERQVRVPNNKLTALSHLNKFTHELEQKLGRTATLNDILDAGRDVTSEEFASLMEISEGHAHSIDKPINEEGSTLSELMESKDIEPTDYAITKSENYSRLDQLIDTLDDNSAKVLRMFFGIGYHYEMSLLDIGKEFGVSRERIRQIKENSLKKLQKRAEGLDFHELKL